MKSLGFNTWLHCYLSYVICRRVRQRGGRRVGVLQRLRQPDVSGSDRLVGAVPDGDARRSRHAGRSGARRRRDRAAEERDQRLHRSAGCSSSASSTSSRSCAAPQGLWNLGKTTIADVNRDARADRAIVHESARSLLVVSLLAAAVLVVGADAPARRRRRSRSGSWCRCRARNAQNGRDILNGFLLYLDEIGYRAGGRADRAHRRRRRSDSGGGADEGAEAGRARQGPPDGRRAAVLDRLRARAVHRLDADPDGLPGGVRRRSDAAAAQQVDRAHRLERQPAEPRVRRVRLPRR